MNEYKRVVYFPDIDWCHAIVGLQSSFLAGLLMNEVKKIGKDMINICTKTGSFKAFNISSDSEFVTYFPVGEFNNEIILHDEEDNNIFNMSIKTYNVEKTRIRKN